METRRGLRVPGPVATGSYYWLDVGAGIELGSFVRTTRALKN